MAASTTTHKSTTSKPAVQNGLGFIWLDDSAEQDPNLKSMFLTLFEQVFLFTDAAAALEVVESADTDHPCISILVSGKYGQMLVPDRLQPLNQVKDIYVYCMDIVKHNQWAQKCDKVRCVDSDFNKILKRIQQDLPKTGKQKQKHQHQQPMEDQPEEQIQIVEEEQVELIVQEPERFTNDNNLYDQLALELVLRNSDKNDGVEDFKKYCQTYNQNKNEGDQLPDFQADLSIHEWYKPDLVFVQLNSTDFTQIWTLRWFIRLFYQQLTDEHELLIRDVANIVVNYGTWLSTDELDVMKHRIGQMIICTELLFTYASRQKALNSLDSKKDEKRKHKAIFEINVDTSLDPTVPYGKIQNNEVLFWFGTRYRLLKIEYIESKDENQEAYWLIGLHLSPTFDSKPSIRTLYDYYLKNLRELNNLHHAFGRILMYKGLYYQAEKWLQINHHYEELTEIAIRQNHIEQANEYLGHLSEDSDDANLLRAYVHLLTSSDNISKGRGILMRIVSEATDIVLRARANLALGFVSLITSQQIDQTLDYFKLGNKALGKHLPDIHPDIAKSFIGIGYTYYTQQNINEAEKAFQMALEIQKQSLTVNHPDIAKTRNGLAHCFATDKRTMKEALTELESAFDILIQTFPREYKIHPEILFTKNDNEKLRKGKKLQARNTLLDYI